MRRAIKALCRLYEGSIKALLRLYEGFIKALLRRQAGGQEGAGDSTVLGGR